MTNPRFLRILFAVLLSAPSWLGAQPSGLFAFDNAVGRGSWTPEKQASTLKALGYDGISYNYTKPADLMRWLAATKSHGIRLQGLYVHTFPDRAQPYDPAFKEAIALLKDSGCVIWMTLRETKDRSRNYDRESVAIIEDLANQAAAQGLTVAIYPHAGFYVSTAAEADRLAKLAQLPNVGPSINLCHEFVTGNGGRIDETVRQVAPSAVLVSLNGVDVAGKHYFGRLDQGDYDLAGFVRAVRSSGYRGPFGLQGFKVEGDPEENLRLSMLAWRKLQLEPADAAPLNPVERESSPCARRTDATPR